jgi:hypothetical protein
MTSTVDATLVGLGVDPDTDRPTRALLRPHQGHRPFWELPGVQPRNIVTLCRSAGRLICPKSPLRGADT